MQDQLKRIHDTLSSKYWFWKYEEASVCPPDLLTALITHLTHIEKESWGKRLNFGGVFVNGQLAQANRPLPVPCKVEYYEPKFDIDAAQNLFPPFSPQNVVYEDEDLVIYFKQYGIPTIPNREQRSYNVKVYLEDYLKRKVHMPSRLDTSTCGLVIASASSEMHPRLQRLFERRLIEKTYLLEVPCSVSWQNQTVDDPIGYNATHRVLRQVDPEKGQPATTHFTNLGPGNGITHKGRTLPTTLIAARPITGRTHQIRIHAKCCSGEPLIGDSFYSGIPDEELHLMSSRLRFIHPVSTQSLSVSCPPGLAPEWCPQHIVKSLESLNINA